MHPDCAKNEINTERRHRELPRRLRGPTGAIPHNHKVLCHEWISRKEKEIQIKEFRLNSQRPPLHPGWPGVGRGGEVRLRHIPGSIRQVKTLFILTYVQNLTKKTSFQDQQRGGVGLHLRADWQEEGGDRRRVDRGSGGGWRWRGRYCSQRFHTKNYRSFFR